MLRGAQKRMIVVKTNDSSLFEEAYFVVRREADTGRMDMLAEANKIIESCDGGRRKKENGATAGRIKRWLFFLAGSIAGGGAATAIALLLR